MASERRDTIVALSTAPGLAGIAIVRLSGPRALEIALQRLEDPSDDKPSSRLPHAKAQLCWLRDSHGRRMDQVLAVAFHAPHSYTGETVVELHLHGSPWIVNTVLTDLAQEASIAERGEFTRRAVENGRLSLDQAEAVLELYAAQGAMAHQLALRGLAGAIGHRVRQILCDIQELRCLIEAELDFSEHAIDHTPVETLRHSAQAIQATLREWLGSWQIGRLVQGAKVVLAGAPNAGKSTLMNALVGEPRVLVDESPGTTRDAISHALGLGGLSLTLWDTAGLRATVDRVEQQGVQRTRQLMEEADLVLQVLAPGERSEGADGDDEKVLTVYAKSDLVLNQPVLATDKRSVAVSAKTGEGLERLRELISEYLLGTGWQQLDLVICEARHRQLVDQAAGAMEHFLEALEWGFDRSLLAVDLLETEQTLSEITGAANPDDLYPRIFSRFCIGK